MNNSASIKLVSKLPDEILDMIFIFVGNIELCIALGKEYSTIELLKSVKYENLWNFAVQTNRPRVAWWLHKNDYKKSSRGAIEYAVREGRKDILLWFFKIRGEKSITGMLYVSFIGDVDMAKWLNETIGIEYRGDTLA